MDPIDDDSSQAFATCPRHACCRPTAARDEDYLRVVSSLRVLTGLRRDQKLGHDGACLVVYATSPAQGLLRWYHGEGRERTIDAVRDLVDSAFRMLDALLRRRDAFDARATPTEISPDVLANNLLHALRDASAGLRVLESTYRDDTSATAKISQISVLLDSRIEQVIFRQTSRR